MAPPFLVIGYVWCRKLHKETWGGWSFESLEEWWLYIKLAVPGLLMIVLEWSGFEALMFLAGSLGETALSANIVLYQLVVILFMVS
jgi:MATE family multidrug resistance protein